MHFSTLISSLFCASVAIATPTAGAKPWRHGHGHGHGGSPTPTGTCPNSGISRADAAAVVDQFTTDGIIPDLIERIKPTVNVNVVYNTSDVGPKAVDLGTYFTTLETINAPTLTFSAEPGFDANTTKYIYFLLDPDVPENGSPVQVTFEHWAVGNAQPDCITDQNATTLVIYEPLTPASTTQHRYTFLVYRQPADFDPADVQLQLQLRTPFDINDFTEKYNLTLVGGNFLKEAIDNGLQDGT